MSRSKHHKPLKPKKPGVPAPPLPTPSFLVEETKSQERRRRVIEQQSERQFGPVIQRHHPEETPQQNAEATLQDPILQHPDLESQLFDGIDIPLSPAPPLGTPERMDHDNAIREEQNKQNHEKQLRLGLAPTLVPSHAPKPRGPS
jgi:hypothetical protein